MDTVSFSGGKAAGACYRPPTPSSAETTHRWRCTFTLCASDGMLRGNLYPFNAMEQNYSEAVSAPASPEISAFHGTQSFVTLWTTAHHLSPSWGTSTQSTSVLFLDSSLELYPRVYTHIFKSVSSFLLYVPYSPQTSDLNTVIRFGKEGLTYALNYAVFSCFSGFRDQMFVGNFLYFGDHYYQFDCHSWVGWGGSKKRYWLSCFCRIWLYISLDFCFSSLSMIYRYRSSRMYVYYALFQARV
jgi:hypothetical protein